MPKGKTSTSKGWNTYWMVLHGRDLIFYKDRRANVCCLAFPMQHKSLILSFFDFPQKRDAAAIVSTASCSIEKVAEVEHTFRVTVSKFPLILLVSPSCW